MSGDPDTKPTTSSSGITVEECQNMIEKSLKSIILLNFISFNSFTISVLDSLPMLYIVAPMVKFLKEQMEKSGCGIGSNFIRAIRCQQEGIAGGYERHEGVFE